MSSLDPQDKDPIQQRAHAQPSNSTHNNIETSQTVRTTDYFHRDTAETQNPSSTSYLLPNNSKTIEIDEIEEIYDSNPLSPNSDEEENIYDNDTVEKELLETAIAYTTTGEDEVYDDENIYDNDTPDGEIIIENTNTAGDNYEDEDIYDNEIPDDDYSKASAIPIRPRAQTHYESVNQWVPQIGRERKKSDIPHSSVNEGTQNNGNSSPPREDDDG